MKGYVGDRRFPGQLYRITWMIGDCSEIFSNAVIDQLKSRITDSFAKKKKKNYNGFFFFLVTDSSLID